MHRVYRNVHIAMIAGLLLLAIAFEAGALPALSESFAAVTAVGAR